MRAIKGISSPHFRLLLLLLLILPFGWQAGAQDWVRTGTNLGAARIRLAAADFNPASADAQTPALKTTFDTTLYSDLNNAGIFDMVSKSMAPPLMPASPQQMNLAAWAAAPANAAFVAFGSLSVTGGRLAVYGWLFDAKNPDSPQILGKQYNEAASQDNARLIAHRFADEIITRLGGGIPGIAETHIFYVASRGGNKEIWQMDYDGQGAHAGHPPGHHFPFPARLAQQRSHRVCVAGTPGLVHPHVFAGAGPRGQLSVHGRDHAFPGMVERRRQACVLRFTHG